MGGLGPIGRRCVRFGMLGAALRRLEGDGAAVARVGGAWTSDLSTCGGGTLSLDPKRWRNDFRGGEAFAALLAVAAVGRLGVPFTPDNTGGAGTAGAGLGCRRSRTGMRLGLAGAFCGVDTSTKSSLVGRAQGVLSFASNGELSRLGGGEDRYEAPESVV